MDAGAEDFKVGALSVRKGPKRGEIVEEEKRG